MREIKGKKKKTTHKIRKKYVAMLVILVALGILFCFALNDFVQGGGLAKSTVRAETVYMVVSMLLILPVLLLIFVILAFKRRSIYIGGGDDYAVALDDVAVPSIETPSKPVEVSETKQSKSDEEEDEEQIEVGEKKRFYKLSQIDEERGKYKREKYDENVTLKNFCDGFRNFACSRMRLYYDIADIRRFIAGMAVSKLIILQGISGTGKTSLANAFGEFLDNPSTVIPVQPMWKERTDLVGYYNEFTKSFNVTKLLEKMYEANYSKDMYVTVLDEMNIARVEYYFAEFLSLLELPSADKRWLDVITDKWDNDPIQLVGGKIKLPDNMWFVGTANNDDSTFSISDKVYDRAMILNLDQKCEEFTAPKTKQIHVSAERFESLVREAEKEYALTKRNQRRLEKLDAYLIENLGITFGNRIMKQIKTYIPVYVACGGEELEALDDILAKKVMRKLEMQNPVYVRNAAEGFCNRLDELFGQDKMKLCKAVIHRLEKNA